MFSILALFVSGMFLSAFFSGHETGFYRVTQLRLMVDAMRGSKVSRGLYWLSNNPSVFIATTLIGNNIANYLTSLSVVLGARMAFGADAVLAEIAAPIALSPLLFVYGELLPKYVFFQAPHRFLKQGGLLFLIFTIVVLPFTLILWTLARALEWVLGQSTENAWQSLARVELTQIFKEGEDAGVLKPAQRELAFNLVAIASEPVSRFAIPTTRYPSIEQGSRIADAVRLAKRNRQVVLPVRPKGGRELVGYVSVIELRLQESETIEQFQPLIDLENDRSIGEALLEMHGAKASLARVIDKAGEVTGLISTNHLTKPLFTGDLLSLRR